MAQQHVFTSAPQGLKPGTRGFTTVGASRDLTPTLISRLELLSGYTLPAAQPDAKTKFAPVNFMHVKLTVGGEKHTLVSRIAPTGVDYTGRSNTLAHHLIVGKKEEPPAGPAWLAMHSGLLMSQWTGQPRQLPSMQLPPGDAPGKPCQTWAKVMGDASYAGSLVAPIINQPGRPIAIIHTPEQAPFIPEMLFEAISILPQSLRWDVTFSTYFTSAAPDVHCRIRCILSTDPLAEQVRRVASVVLLDLTQKTSGRPIAGEPFDSAKKGGTWPNLNPASDASEETSDRVHPAAAKMLRAKPIPQLQDLILAEIPDDPSGVHPPAALPAGDLLARNRAARKDDWATYKTMAIAAGSVIGSVGLITVGAFYFFSASSSSSTSDPSTTEVTYTPAPPATLPPVSLDPAPRPVQPAPSVTPPAPRLANSTTADPNAGVSATPRTAVTTPAPGTGAVTSGASFGKQLTPLKWTEFKIFDEGNSRFDTYKDIATNLPVNLVQPLVREGQTLIARFPDPLPKALTEAEVFEVVINLPTGHRELQASISSKDPANAEVRRPSTDLAADSTLLFTVSIDKQKDNKLMQVRIEPGMLSLDELRGASLVIHPPADNFANKQDAREKAILLAFFADPAAKVMAFDIPANLADADKPMTSLNSSQTGQFTRLRQWFLAQPAPATAPTGRWSEVLLPTKTRLGRNQIAPDSAFQPVVMLPSGDVTVPYLDVIINSQSASSLRTLGDLRREAGKKKLELDIARSKLKETVDALNNQGVLDDEYFRRVSPTAGPAEVVKDIEADGKRVSGTVSSKLASLLTKAKEDARSALSVDKEYAALAAAFKAAVSEMSSVKYEGVDVFGNVAATATLNIDKTGQASAPAASRNAASSTIPGPSTSASPPLAP